MKSSCSWATRDLIQRQSSLSRISVGPWHTVGGFTVFSSGRCERSVGGYGRCQAGLHEGPMVRFHERDPQSLACVSFQLLQQKFVGSKLKLTTVNRYGWLTTISWLSRGWFGVAPNGYRQHTGVEEGSRSPPPFLALRHRIVHGTLSSALRSAFCATRHGEEPRRISWRARARGAAQAASKSRPIPPPPPRCSPLAPRLLPLPPRAFRGGSLAPPW